MSEKVINPIKELIAEVVAYHRENEKSMFEDLSMEDRKTLYLWDRLLRKRIDECGYSQATLLELVEEYRKLTPQEMRDWFYE